MNNQTFRLLIIIGLTAIATSVFGLIFSNKKYFHHFPSGMREIPESSYMKASDVGKQGVIIHSEFNIPVAVIAGGATMLIISIIIFNPAKSKKIANIVWGKVSKIVLGIMGFD